MIGTMFLIKPDRFEEMLQSHIDYFRNKWKQEPFLFIVHPSFDSRYKLPDGLNIVVQAEKYILPDNLWMIINDKQREDKNNQGPSS